MLKLKKSKYIFAAVLSLLLLGGCGKKSPNASDGTEQTAPDTSASSAETTVPVSEATAAETEKSEEKTTAVSPEAEKTVLMRLVQTAASEGEERTFDITDELFGDFDGDGRYELIAGCAGYYWYTDGKKTEILLDEYWGMKLDSIEVSGQTVITLSNENDWYTYLYVMKNGELAELEASGKFGKITASGNGDGIFTAISHDYDNCVGIEREHTWKPYWLYFEDGEFKEYVGEKITKADFMKYTGGKAALDETEADGGTVTDILYRENGIVNVNYTVDEDGAAFNKFKIYDVSGGDCKEIKAIFEGRENDYGVYMPSALSPYGEEQLALHRLIEMTSGGNPWDDIVNPLFGDFDGDGKNELIAEYGSRSENEFWFASGGRAYKLEERLLRDYTMGGRSVPCIIRTAGNTYFMVQHYYAGTLGGTRGSCDYYRIKNSSAVEIGGTTEQNLVPDGDFGDLISDSMAYDCSFDNKLECAIGQSWKNYWFYFLDGEIRQYYGREITREEFLKYEGAEKVLDEIAADGKEVDEILKRGNGTISLNLSQQFDGGTQFRNKTFKYRNGKLFPAGENDGTYWDKFEEFRYAPEPTDFERFCEMIYDSSEGGKDARIRERFYGDIDSDGKNELYAYYGTDESSSLWFADENGAEKVTDGTDLFIADGDAVLKNNDRYFIVRDGKSKRLNSFGAKNMERSENGDFTGIITAEDAYSDNTVKTEKEYWFYYKDGDFHEYTAKEITEEQLADYKGARAALDEIASMGGEVVSILQRDNGIININYNSHMQELTMHYYLTLKIDGKGRAENITPKNDDGTLNNKGYYLHSLKAGN